MLQIFLIDSMEDQKKIESLERQFHETDSKFAVLQKSLEEGDREF